MASEDEKLPCIFIKVPQLCRHGARCEFSHDVADIRSGNAGGALRSVINRRTSPASVASLIPPLIPTKPEVSPAASPAKSWATAASFTPISSATGMSTPATSRASTPRAPTSGAPPARSAPSTLTIRSVSALAGSPSTSSPASSSEANFRNWRFQIPRPQHPARRLGNRLGYFFQQALELVSSDAATMQEVITLLASDGGLRRIDEITTRDLTDLGRQATRLIFLNEVLPLLSAITLPTVLVSAVLEVPLAQLYNFLYGAAGQRAVKLFSFVAEAVSFLILDNPEEQDYDTSTALETVSTAFWKVIELNGQAHHNSDLKLTVERVIGCIDKAQADDALSISDRSRKCIEKIQLRFGIAAAIPHLQRRPVQPLKRAVFTLKREPPGDRHDNDHLDICNIKILPTYSEILSSKGEYLPTDDLSESHLSGLDALLDRHFRLLREDTVGQLRDAVRVELEKLHSMEVGGLVITKQQRGVRTFTHRNVNIMKVGFSWALGFEFMVRFDQPLPTRTLSQIRRKDWWEHSRSLPPDGLVCLVSTSGTVVFCTVPDQTPTTKRLRSPLESWAASLSEPMDLWSNEQYAFATLRLAHLDEDSIRQILAHQQHGAMHQQLSLVEFPGVLLASFEPTLKALQKLKLSGDLPFAEFLIPRAESAEEDITVPTPSYASRDGFCYNLRPLMTDGRALELDPRGSFEVDLLREGSTLDDAQAAAVVDAFTRSLALIQGPPGTGKSFTGVAVIKALLANKSRAKLGPIVCVCFTNHALDQLLEHLVTGGVQQVIRIGSRSKSQMLQDCNLYLVSQKMEHTKTENTEKFKLRNRLRDAETELKTLLGVMESIDHWTTIRDFLERAYPEHYGQLYGTTDQDGFSTIVHHPENRLAEWLYARPGEGEVNGIGEEHSKRSIGELLDADLLTMTYNERWLLCHHWRTELHDELQENVGRLVEEYTEAKAQYDHIKQEVDLRCLQQANVVGVTTSGLARNLDLLRRLQSKVMLCEEAGEVLEAHLLTALLPSVEHAILIGDHQQLRPQVQNYDLNSENPRGAQYSLDVSLFERLVHPKYDNMPRLPYSTLEIQRRMHPSISRLIRETLYPALQDVPAVSTYPEVIGLRRRLFWFDHRELEDPGDMLGSTSKTNEYEVNMVAMLISHLVRQGVYKPDDIAVLTPYLGQLQKLRQKLKHHVEIAVSDRDETALLNEGLDVDEDTPGTELVKTTLLRSVRVATVDNFQGEEAKVVIISLVRSNIDNNCGFLRTSNRINVLLSRAKHGMYVIGNSKTSGHIPMWQDVLKILKSEGNLGPELELQCPRHPNATIKVQKPDDFQQLAPEGGCDLVCSKLLRCGHDCPSKCHSDVLHSAVVCSKPCTKSMESCDHPCPRACGESCERKCTVIVSDSARTLACGHPVGQIPCYASHDLSLVKCKILVDKTVPGCGHVVQVQCSESVDYYGYRCKVQCGEILPCGHICKSACSYCRRNIEEAEDSEEDSADFAELSHGECRERCRRAYADCQHSCQKYCHAQDVACEECQSPCEVACSHSTCPKKCSEPCIPCTKEKCASGCLHSKCTMPCAAPCDWLPCNKRCEDLLKCGHQCPSTCGEICPDQKVCQICCTDDIKERCVDLFLDRSYGEIDLDADPCIFPQCGHFLTMTTMDNIVDISAHYKQDAVGTFWSATEAIEPFASVSKALKSCPTCHASLRNIGRYGRLVRGQMFDDAIKSYISRASTQYVELATSLLQEMQKVSKKDEPLDRKSETDLSISGTRIDQFRAIIDLAAGNPRWLSLSRLRRHTDSFVSHLQHREEPYSRVSDMVIKRGLVGLKLRSHLQASALLVRCDIVMLADAVRSWPTVKPHATLRLDLSRCRKDCEQLILHAGERCQPAIQAEGHLFWAQYAALECKYPNYPLITEDLSALALDYTEDLRVLALQHTEHAKKICEEDPTQTRGVGFEVMSTRLMLKEGFSTATVNEDDWHHVLAAMSREASGMGVWHYCQRGHPFAVSEGEEAGSMGCPQCGADVGGSHGKVGKEMRRDSSLEGMLGDMGLE